MSPASESTRILIIDSGGGYGDNGTFLRDFLKHLDKSRFQPFVAFYRSHVSPETSAVQQMGIPVLFLSRASSAENSLHEKFFSDGPSWKWIRLSKLVLFYLLQFLLFDLRRLWKLLWILKEHSIGLILLNNDIHFHLVGALAVRITRVPCICRKAGGIGEGKILKRILTPWVDLFIAISAATAKDQLENNPSTKRVVSIFEGVDLDRFVPGSHYPSLREELGIPAGIKIVVCASRLVMGKEHRELVEAASFVVKNYKQVLFLIAGDSTDGCSLKNNLRARVQALGLSSHFIFTGWRTDIPEILSLADMFVHCPTTWIEGLGIAHLEAMAMGKPTVVSENGGLPDAAVNGVTGFVIPPGDIARLSSAILQLLNDEELRLRMGRSARHRAEDLFDIRKNTRVMEALLQEYSAKNPLGSKKRLPGSTQDLDATLHKLAE